MAAIKPERWGISPDLTAAPDLWRNVNSVIVDIAGVDLRTGRDVRRFDTPISLMRDGVAVNLQSGFSSRVEADGKRGAVNGFQNAATFLWHGQLDSKTNGDSDNRAAFATNYVTTTNDRAWYIEFRNGATDSSVSEDAIAVALTDDGANFQGNSTFGLESSGIPYVGVPITVIVTWTSNNAPSAFVNGVELSVLDVVSSIPSIAENDAIVLVGTQEWAQTRNLIGKFSHFIVWGERALDANAISRLSRDPFIMFRQAGDV